MDTIEKVAAVLAAVAVLAWLLWGLNLWLTPKKKNRDDEE